jgi:hypothetical protein
MTRLFSNFPRAVLISLAVGIAAIAIIATTVPVLGGARDDAYAQNSRLNGDIARVRKGATDTQADIDYVQQNGAQYEALLQSDRLVPHTRRAAIVELENSARNNGLTAMTYTIGAAAASTSAQAVQSQSAAGGYRVSVENISLKVGAPTDGSIYNFIADITSAFPGSAVVQSMAISRASFISAAALEALSRGEDPKLVEADIIISWRTAQAEEKKDEGKK